MRSPLPQFLYLFRGEFFLGTEADAPFFGLLDSIYLPLSAYFRFELADRAEHIEQQTARRIVRIDALIEDLEIDLFSGKLFRDLAQMQGRASQPIQAGHDEGIAFPDVLQALLQAGSLTRAPASFLLKDFVTVAKLVQLDIEALTD